MAYFFHPLFKDSIGKVLEIKPYDSAIEPSGVESEVLTLDRYGDAKGVARLFVANDDVASGTELTVQVRFYMGNAAAGYSKYYTVGTVAVGDSENFQLNRQSWFIPSPGVQFKFTMASGSVNIRSRYVLV